MPGAALLLLQALGLGMNDVFTALQSTLGGYYVNDYQDPRNHGRAVAHVAALRGQKDPFECVEEPPLR